MSKKASYIAGETNDQDVWEKLDAFRFQLYGWELAMIVAAWETRKTIVDRAYKSIDQTFTFKEKIKLPGKPKEELMQINHAPDTMDFNIPIYKLGDTITPENRKKKFHKYYQSELEEYQISRTMGMHVLSSLIWIITAGNAQPENITKTKPTSASSTGIEQFGDEISDELDMLEEEVIIEGYNSTQLEILNTLQEKVISFLGKEHEYYEKWKEIYTIREVGEDYFQLQELIMQTFPDPLDELKNKEMEHAKEEINKKGDSEGEEDLW